MQDEQMKVIRAMTLAQRWRKGSVRTYEQKELAVNSAHDTMCPCQEVREWNMVWGSP